jgi:hypothetical protein
MKRLLVALLVIGLAGCAPLTRRTAAPGESEAFSTGGYSVEVCDAAYAGRAAACTLTGQGTRQVLRGNLISNGRVLLGGHLAIDASGHVESASCQVPSMADATFLDCPGSLISAGLLNLHEHIDYSYQQPDRPPALKWKHRNEWRKLSAAERGFEGDAPTDKIVQTEVSERAMLRHAMSGSTAVSGAKDFRAFLRNLKLPDEPLGTPYGKPVLDNTFPVGDGGSKQTLEAPCTAAQVAAVRFVADQAFIPHVGEGVNAGAKYEVDCVLDAILAKATPNAFIHGVAISSSQIERLRQQNVAVVLSPRSNLELYGATAPVAELKAAGVTLAMGTDWSPSGSLTLLDEARCLARYNRDSLNGLLSGADLHRMMTSDGARAVGLQGHVGALAPGEWADVVVFDTEGRLDLADILEHTALPQTMAVLIGGRIASAPAAWAGRLPQLDHCEVDPRDLCGAKRLVCGANGQRPLARLLQQTVYTIDDSRLCRPQPTDDCVAARP